MTDITIYHNPRCSKSRQTLELLEEKGVTPRIVLYLETPPARAELQALLDKLGMSAKELLRKGEQEYKDMDLKNAGDKEALDAMIRAPRLIERPIVVKGDKAVLGRPPENVLSLIDQ